MNTVTVSMFRSTPRVDEVVAFYQTLGLQQELVAGSGNYVELVGRSGRLQVHHGDSVETALSFHVPLASQAQKEFADEGLQCLAWDEAYGQQLAIEHPRLGKIWICEEQQDLHGYRRLETTASHLGVVGVVYSDDFAGDVDFFARLGFTPDGDGDEYWQALTAGSTAGHLGLHKPDATSPNVELSLTTDESLDVLEARLREEGLSTKRFADEFITYVAVTDPDGVEVQIHPSAK